jgi:methionyl-tRNA formyltransferase
MRLVFAGTPAFAREALEALLQAGHEVCLVLTQPDRPAGRGLKLQASPVKQLALAHNIPLAQPRSLRLDGRYPEDAQQARDALQACGAQAMVVAAYGLILPDWVLSLPPQGCLNIHASLLPRWRGAAPIHRAIEAGDRDSGITIMQMDAGLDTGDMLLVAREPIDPRDSTASLHDRLATLGGRLMVEALTQLDTLRRTPQPAEGVSYAHKIEKHEAPLDWRRDALSLARQVRAFDPFPGAQAQRGEDVLKVWQCDVTQGVAGSAAPGTVVAASPAGIDVATGRGVLRLLALQRAGGRRVAVAEYLRGHPIRVGEAFNLPAVAAQRTPGVSSGSPPGAAPGKDPGVHPGARSASPPGTSASR